MESAAAIAALQGEMQELKEKLMNYEVQQSDLQARMTSTIKEEINSVAGGLHDLYRKTEQAVTNLEMRTRTLEQAKEKMTSSMTEKATLLSAKDMKPNILQKDEEWRRWKSDIEDYTEEVFRGMKEMLDKAKGAENEIAESWFSATEYEWWGKAEMLYRFLKRFTGTEARRIVMGVSDDNGWEAWRKLNQQFEPGSVTREAQVLAKYTNMVNRKAKTPKETKALMIELNERAKRVEEVTGRPVEARHAMSVIAGILDPETSKHTAQYQGLKSDVETLKRKVMEFTNLVTNYADDKMDIGRIEQWADEEVQDDVDVEEYEQLGAVNDQCHRCGGYGHFARDCATKGKGKSKGKGKGPLGKGGAPSKGGPFGKGGQKGDKGKGKGGKGHSMAPAAPQYGVCWTCGGSHFARDCPQGGAPNSKGAGKGEVRTLSSVKEVATMIRTHNRFNALSSVDEDEERGGDEVREASHQPRQNETQQKLIDATKKKSYAEVVAAEKVGRLPPGQPHRRWRGTLGSLIEVVPECVSAVEEQEWEEIELAVDSGATETVIGEDMLKNIDLKQGEAYKRGVQYEVASGELIPNLGEKKFMGICEGGEERMMTAQVCDVNKALLSVKRMVQAGNRVVFEPQGGYVEDTKTGDKIYMRDSGGMYMLKMWVRRPFHGQAE